MLDMKFNHLLKRKFTYNIWIHYNKAIFYSIDNDIFILSTFRKWIIWVDLILCFLLFSHDLVELILGFLSWLLSGICTLFLLQDLPCLLDRPSRAQWLLLDGARNLYVILLPKEFQLITEYVLRKVNGQNYLGDAAQGHQGLNLMLQYAFISKFYKRFWNTKG